MTKTTSKFELPVTVCDCASGSDALTTALEIIDEMSQVRCLEWLLTVSELIENVIANIVLARVRNGLEGKYDADQRTRMMMDTHEAVMAMLMRNAAKAHKILQQDNARVHDFVLQIAAHELEDHTDVQLQEKWT
jgi:hypothetical protein